MLQLAPMESSWKWMLAVVAAAVLVLGSGMWEHAFDPPYSIHEWRQRDALSQTLRYLEEDRGFFEPAMHFQHSDGGRAAGEFTGLYYLNAQVWKVLGRPVPWTLRWTQGLFMLLGLLALAAALRNWTGTWTVGVWAAWAVLVTPLMQFYGANYLVNPTGLMAVFGAWWMWSCSERRKSHALWWAAGAALLLMIAGWLRPTMLLGGVPLLVRWWSGRTVGAGPAFALGALVMLGVGAWVVWAKSYNEANHSAYFLTTLRPLWNTPNVKEVWDSLVTVRLQEVHHLHVRYLGAVLIALTAWRSRGKWAVDALAFLLTSAGAVAYGVLWFKNLDVHDYYLLELLMVVPLLAVWGYEVWKETQWRKAMMALLALASIYQMGHTFARNRMKWGQTDGWLVEQFVPKSEREEWKWYHADRRERLEPLLEVRGRLKEWGVPDDAWVLSLPDGSPNITLTLLNRFGFTGLYENDLHAGERVAWAASRGADFLVVNKTEILESGDWGLWLSDELGRHRGVVVFDLRRIRDQNGR